MKTLLLLLTLTCLSNSRSEGGVEIIVKKVTKAVNTHAEATNWKLDELTHKEWLAEISVEDWLLLHESETKDWHFAVFRDGDRLIFWKGNKKGINSEMQFGLLAVGNSKTMLLAPRKPGIDQPQIAEITHEFSFPGGSSSHNAFGDIWKINSKFSGKIGIKFSVKVAGVFAPALDQNVEWK